SDVQLAEMYDGFSFITMAWLEAMRFCGKGESGPFVEGGQRIARDGELALNTHGGQLSAGRLHGYRVPHEAGVQVWGEGGARRGSGRCRASPRSVSRPPAAARSPDVCCSHIAAENAGCPEARAAKSCHDHRMPRGRVRAIVAGVAVVGGLILTVVGVTGALG